MLNGDGKPVRVSATDADAPLCVAVKKLQNIYFLTNKQEIVQKVREMPFSVKTVKDRRIKMATNITSKLIDDITSQLPVISQVL